MEEACKAAALSIFYIRFYNLTKLEDLGDFTRIKKMPIDLPIVRLGAAPIFDAYIFVDWSAAAEPIHGRHGIWIAEGLRLDRELLPPAAWHVLALPLLIRESSGAPARVIAVSDGPA
jgi:kynurenine formamidase